ncbi:MAG: phage integrase N-terminal SAM-like domain-containing protein [Terracidiphilus sp.]
MRNLPHYNHHWGGEDGPVPLLCDENPIVEHKAAPGFPRDAEESDGFLTDLFDPPYPDYDKGSVCCTSFSGATTHRPQRGYLNAVSQFAEYFHRSPEQLGAEHLRRYQRYLLQERKLAPSTVEMRISALRFLAIEEASSCSAVSAAGVRRALSSETTSLLKGMDVMSVIKLSLVSVFERRTAGCAEERAVTRRGTGQHGLSERRPLTAPRAAHTSSDLKTRQENGRSERRDDHDDRRRAMTAVVVFVIVMGRKMMVMMVITGATTGTSAAPYRTWPQTETATVAAQDAIAQCAAAVPTGRGLMTGFDGCSEKEYLDLSCLII